MLEDAVFSFQTPSQIRFLFAHLIIEGYPARPLWDSLEEQLTIDHILATSSAIWGWDNALRCIAELLQEGGRHLSNYGLPNPTTHSIELCAEIKAFSDKLHILHQTANDMVSQMTTEQIDIFNMIVNTITQNMDNQTMHNNTTFFIEGRPSQGKTFLVDAICSRLQSEGLIILIVGSSALAATLYERGRTAHSMFGIPVKDVWFQSSSNFCLFFIYLTLQDNTDLHSKIGLNSMWANVIDNASAIAWDEFPMANKSSRWVYRSVVQTNQKE